MPDSPSITATQLILRPLTPHSEKVCSQTPADHTAFAEHSKLKPRYGVTNASPRQEYGRLCRDWWTEVWSLSSEMMVGH